LEEGEGIVKAAYAAAVELEGVLNEMEASDVERHWARKVLEHLGLEAALEHTRNLERERSEIAKWG
jgi:hypothetical protein